MPDQAHSTPTSRRPSSMMRSPLSARSSLASKQPITVSDGSLSARNSSQNASSGRELNRKEYEARRKKIEHAAKHAKLQAMRDEDSRMLKERAAKLTAQRTNRFEEMLEGITKEDNCRVEIADMLGKHDAKQEQKKFDLYKKWDDAIFQNIEQQLHQFVADTMPEDGVTPIPNHRCPMKSELHQKRREDEFRKNANMVLSEEIKNEVEEIGLREHVKRRELRQKMIKERDQTRPVFPIHNWEQLRHCSTTYGFHARDSQSLEQGGTIRPARRLGYDAHLPDEDDGVPAAGKTKVRHERNCLGMLAGNVAREGESARHKKPHGASSGAPCQDHYFYEKGLASVDAEFPIGKRCFNIKK